MAEKKRSRSPRLWVQGAFALLTNGYLRGFAAGRIYTGPSKAVCVPGLNCYSCPGALGACPLGSLQNTLAGRHNKLAFYALGWLLAFGALFGRFICGFLCPFGLVQDLLYRIPVFRRWRAAHKTLPGEKLWRCVRYGLLAVLCVLLPLIALDVTGQGKPWFCAYVCPAGTLEAGIPLVLANAALQKTVGFLFSWKVLVLGVILAAALLLWRPFCRYLCPLGAVYGLFNRFALVRFSVEESRCIRCGACRRACKMDIEVWRHPNSADCVRCGDCRAACPTQAIQWANGRARLAPNEGKF